MITSITIKNEDSQTTVTGCPHLCGCSGIGVTKTDNTLSISVSDTSNLSHPYLDVLDNTSKSLPYVSSIAGIRPDTYGNFNVISDVTTQIDVYPEQSELRVCDMSQDNRYPQIFRAIYDMITILRRHIDGHKDSLLLMSEDANDQWDAMIQGDKANDYVNYYINEYGTLGNDYPLMKTQDGELIADNRKREEIAAIESATKFMHEYQSVVALWNHIVASPESDFSVRVHPADNAGIYVGIALNVPVTEPKDIEIIIKITLKCTGQAESSDNFYIWLRSPDAYSKVVPATDDTSVSVAIPGEQCISNNTLYPVSDLDREGLVNKYTNGDELTATYTVKIPENSDMKNTYTVQAILEAVPFCRCGSELSYVDSRRGVHYIEQDKNTWDVEASVWLTTYKTTTDGTITDKTEVKLFSNKITKDTQYATVCEDPYTESTE